MWGIKFKGNYAASGVFIGKMAVGEIIGKFGKGGVVPKQHNEIISIGQTGYNGQHIGYIVREYV